MVVLHPTAATLFDTPHLLARAARLREDWRLSVPELDDLLGASEPGLHAGLRRGSTILPAAVEARIRTLDEISSLARQLLGGGDPAEWIRLPSDALLGRTPLDVLTNEPVGARAIRTRLRAECMEVFG